MTTNINRHKGNKNLINIEAAREGKHILIYADGSCYGNPDPGGYAAVLRRMDGAVLRGRPKKVAGYETDTTNVRMEMTAVVTALEFLKQDESETIVVVSDNELIANGMTKWIQNWIAKGWRKSDGKPVENRDLWERMRAASEGKNVVWRWVRGHAGNPFNEEVDSLAKGQMAIARPASYGFAA